MDLTPFSDLHEACERHSMASSGETTSDVVTLKGMRFHARIGVLPHEAEIAQSIEVDASLWVRRTSAPLTPKDIVDYRRVYDLVADVVTHGHISFLEEVGERIADRALETSRWMVRRSGRAPRTGS